jgi:hypothetical protein
MKGGRIGEALLASGSCTNPSPRTLSSLPGYTSLLRKLLGIAHPLAIRQVFLIVGSKQKSIALLLAVRQQIAPQEPTEAFGSRLPPIAPFLIVPDIFGPGPFPRPFLLSTWSRVYADAPRKHPVYSKKTGLPVV